MQKEYITDPAIAAAHPSKYLGILGMFWVSFLLIMMFTVTKTFSVGPVVFAVAVLAYPFTYIFADIFTEVYGYRITRRIVWTGFACMLLASVVTYIYSLVPPSASFPAEAEASFEFIFKGAPIVALATIAGYFGGELTNSYVLAKLKVLTSGRWQGLRYIGSTFAGQIVDNTVAFTIIFTTIGVFSKSEIPSLIASSVVFCTLWELCVLPITYRAIAWIKYKEGLDTYDRGTNFNPFLFKQ